MSNSLFTLVQFLLSKNKIIFDKEELKLQIESHPSYPSLHAITGVLDHFGIENMAFDIPQNRAVYQELPNYFIAHIKIGETKDLVFVNKTSESVKITYSNKKKETLSISNFLTNWTGVVVVVEKDELTLDTLRSNSNLVKVIPLVALVGIAIFSLFYNKKNSIFPYLQLTLSVIGIYISYLLVKHELGYNSKTVEKLCTSSENTSCDAVLNSKGASVLGLFKLSDLSFVYFTTLSLSWFFTLTANNTSILINLISLGVVPIILYSIYYQAIVIKKWCPLCLATASILACQSLVSYFSNPFQFRFTVTEFLIVTLSSLATIIAYSYIKPLLKKVKKLNENEIEFYKFKRKYSLFSVLFNQNKRLNTTLPNLPEITFGNPNAKIKLLTITNPLCGFCKATHQAVDRLLKTNSDELLVTIRFNINTKDRENTAYKIATALLNLYTIDKIACLEALHQIYTDKVDVDAWLNTYNKYVTNSQFNVLDTSYNWCVDNNINFTPAVYLNDREYPKEYQLSDLNLFTENIIEGNEIVKDNLATI